MTEPILPSPSPSANPAEDRDAFRIRTDSTTVFTGSEASHVLTQSASSSGAADRAGLLEPPGERTVPRPIFSRHPEGRFSQRDRAQEERGAVVELRVRNHPGTMSHIAGLFARRAFNLEAILCVPEAGNPDCSRILLLTANDPRLEQVERQLAKLHDVLDVRHRRDLDPAWFDRLASSLGSPNQTI